MELMVYATPGKSVAEAMWKMRHVKCLLGERGAVPADEKIEGDGCTPIGRWPMLLGFYRADRICKPKGAFPWRAIQPGDAFCDDPSTPLYNHFIWPEHPGTQAGGLWKDGHEYDVVVWLGYNVNPIVPNKGSAILLHGIREGSNYTKGCIAIPMGDLVAFADDFGEDSAVRLICY